VLFPPAKFFQPITPFSDLAGGFFLCRDAGSPWRKKAVPSTLLPAISEAYGAAHDLLCRPPQSAALEIKRSRLVRLLF